MPHYVFALLSIGVAGIFFGFAYRQNKLQQFQFAALLIVLGGLLLRVYVASDLFLHEWDERYHALVAKNLLTNFWVPRLYPEALLPYDVHHWASNHVWLHKQPLPLWCMSASLGLFGLSEWALRVPSVLISSIAILLTYVIGKKLFDEKTGLFAAFFHAINGLMIELTGGRVSTDHVDIFFMFFIELGVVMAILSAERKQIVWTVLTGVSIGAAVLCKWLPAFIVLIVWTILNYRYKSIIRIVTEGLLIVLTASLIFIPWQIYAYTNFPKEYEAEMLLNYQHVVEVLDGQGGSVFYFIGKLFITVNEFIWLAFAWWLYLLVKRDKPSYRLALIAWVVVPFIVFTAARTKMQAYLLFTYPTLFIMLADCCLQLLRWHISIRGIQLQKLIFAVIILLSVRYSMERIKPLQDQSKQLYWASKLKKLNPTEPKTVYVNVRHYAEGMFYTNSIMYGYIPSQEQMDELRTKGYKVVINQDPDL